MAEVVPFKGVLYNIPSLPGVSGGDLLAPPYDIITPEHKDELYKKSPYNIVRVDFGKEFSGDNGGTNKYLRARAFLEAWLKEGVLVRGERPGFYSYEISYTINRKETKLRGFLGLVRLEELGKGNIHPHECTHSKPKKDRLEIMRACEANISPIFSLYSSREKTASSIILEVSRQAPYLEARDENGCIHKLWQLTDSDAVESIRKEMSDKPIFIADGHHRYETAIEYQKEMRAKERAGHGPKPYDYVMMFLANMQDEGLTILPTHRLVRKIPPDFLEMLSNYFEIAKIDDDLNVSRAIASEDHVLGFYKGGEELYRLRYKGVDLSDVNPVLASLDVSILHELILRKLLHESEIAYDMDIGKCLKLVREKTYDAAFFLNPTRVEDVERIALASLRMPPKSTFFYPKLMTGIVLNIFKNTF
jgi:uncharacterized protein (DUF1015 family)